MVQLPHTSQINQEMFVMIAEWIPAVTTPRCIVNDDSGVKISLKPTEVPTNPVAKSTNTAELPVRGHRLGGCHSALPYPGLGDGKR